MNSQLKMPESVHEAWMGRSKMVAKTRPDVYRLHFQLGGGDEKLIQVSASYGEGRIERRVSVTVPLGSPWDTALSDALEADYQKFHGGAD